MTASYDIFNIRDKIIPYIEGGVGISRVYLNNLSISDNKGVLASSNKVYLNNLSWSGLLGIAFKVTDNTNVNLGYKYSNFGKAKTVVNWSSTPAEKWKSKRITANEFLVSLSFKI